MKKRDSRRFRSGFPWLSTVKLAVTSTVFCFAQMGCGGGTSISADDLEPGARSYVLEGRVRLLGRVADADGQVQGNQSVDTASGVPVHLSNESGFLDMTHTTDGRYTFSVESPGTYRISSWVVTSDMDSTGLINLGVDRLLVPDTLQLPMGAQESALTLFPNPRSAAGTNIGFSVAAGGNYRLDVLDLSGSPVRNVFDGSIEAGSYTLRWDGTAEDGSDADGHYHWVVLSLSEGHRIYSLTMRTTDG
jgi:hypothetical protein